MAFQGPTRPGDNEKTYRETGKTTPSYQGPVRPSDDEKRFRETGKTENKVSGGDIASGSGASKNRSSSNRSRDNKIQSTSTVIKQSPEVTTQSTKLSSQVKSSGAELQPYKQSDYINDDRAKTGGFWGKAASFLGVGKQVDKSVTPQTRSTIVDTRVQQSPFTINLNKKEKVQEDLMFDPSLAITSTEYNRRVSSDISKDVDSKIKPKFQSRVDAGEDYNKVTAEYQDEFSKEFDKSINSQKTQLKLQKKGQFDTNVAGSYGVDPGQELKKMTGTSLDIAAGFAGPEVSTAYFVGKGVSKKSKGSTKDTLIAEDIGVGQINVPLYPSVKKSKESKEADLYLGFAGVSAATIPNALVKRAGKEQLKELSEQQFTISGKELLKTDKGSLIKINAQRSIGSAKQDVEFLSPQFNINKGAIYGKSESGQDILLQKGDDFTSFFITKGKSRTRAINPIDQNIKIDFTEKFAGGGRSKVADSFKLGYKNNKGEVTKQFDDFTGSYGSGYLEYGSSPGKISKFNFIGGAKDDGDVVKIITGKPKSVRYGNKISIRGSRTGSGTITKLNKGNDVSFIIGSGSKSNNGFGSFTQQEQITTTSIVNNIGKDLKLQQPKTTFKVRNTSPDTKPSRNNQVLDNSFQKEMSGIKQSFAFGGSQSFKDDSIQLNKNSFSFGSGSGLLTSSGSRQSEGLGFGQIEVPRQISKQNNSPKLTPLNPFADFGNPFKDSPTGFGLPPMPKFNLFDFGRRRTKGSKDNFFGKYTPSVTAQAFNIKAFKIPKSYFAGAGGLTMRPIISARKRRKK